MSSISDQPAIYKNLGSDKTLQQIRGGCRASTTRSRSQCHYKVPNWQTYEAGLRQRGSLTIWFTEEAIAAWRAAPRTTPGGQERYSDLAIETSLILRTVFHQPLRQTEGLVGSLLGLMGLDLPVPDHTTLSRRARTLAVAPQVASGPVHLTAPG
jgi:hypothetical protein